MNAVEFTVELSGSTTLAIPAEVAAQLPNTGAVRIIVLTAGVPSMEAEWREASYEQFLADDAPEDAIYDSLRR